MGHALNIADSLGKTAKFTLGEGLSGASSTVLGANAQLKGDIRAAGDVVVLGTLEGELSSHSRITIGAGGSVIGRVIATEIVIEGRLAGESIASKSLSMLGSAEVRGDVTTPVLVIEPGATFVGRCSMPQPEVQELRSPQEAQPKAQIKA